MGVSGRSTVPVTCPHCRHEGPAYLHLLGRLSRCKKCGHGFPMPRHVHMGCPRCRASLRVPAELIGQDVACKFCDESFLADPARAERRGAGPGEPRRTGRRASPGADLLRFLGEHEELRGQLGRLREEINELSRREHRELQEIRSRVDRLAAVRSAFAREAVWTARVIPEAKPHEATPSSPVKHPAGANGAVRAPTAKPAPGRGHRRAAGAQVRPAEGGAAVRELIERLASCEAMTDRLISRLRSTQEQRDEDRATFGRIIARLQEELTGARDRFETGRDDPDSPTERADLQDGAPGAIATTPCLSDCGVA